MQWTCNVRAMCVQQYYRWTSRELKRLSSVTLSPVYSHLSETLAGIPVIRSLGAVSRFCQENLHKVALNQQAVFAALAASQWLNLRLQLLGVLLTSCVALLAVVQHQVRGVSAGFVGLALSYALSVTSLLGSLVTSFTDTEKELVSVERAGQYLRDLEEEPLEGTLLSPSIKKWQKASTHSPCSLRSAGPSAGCWSSAG